MCCIFTCFGWMLDLVQRLWTFLMSCCICSAVCCLLIISAMAGIALGYNYSLAEYIDLKESNVSIFLKRGIFDDEIADMQLRRAAEDRNKGLFRSGNEKSEIPDEKPVKSGRRLDDSVFDGGDQFKYEGSLMKLTAKPPFERSTTVTLTPDFDMASAISSYTRDTLDSLKAIQAVVDSRRAYAATIRGPTVSPVATYPFNEVERYSINLESTPPHQETPGIRRMMPDSGESFPKMNPARLAVPPKDIGEDIHWVAPYRQDEYDRKYKEMGLEPTGFTLPSPIHYNSGPIRPTPTVILTTGGLYLTKYRPVTLFSTRPSDDSEVGAYTKESKVLSFKEKLLAENERPRKPHKPSEDDYDYDVKGLPVRKRRSINDYKINAHNEADRISVKALAHDKQLNDKSTKSTLKGNIMRNPSRTYEVVILNNTYRAEHTSLADPVKQNNTPSVHLEHFDESMPDNTTFELGHVGTLLDKQNGSIFQYLFSYITRQLQMVQKGLTAPLHNDRRDESTNNGDINNNIDNSLEEDSNNRNVSSKSEAGFNSADKTRKDNKTYTGIGNFSSMRETTMHSLFIKMKLPTLA